MGDLDFNMRHENKCGYFRATGDIGEPETFTGDTGEPETFLPALPF